MTKRPDLGAAASFLVVPAVVALLTIPAPAAAQAATTEAPDATLDDFAWLEGTWRGEGPEGATAEIHFMKPRTGVLPAVFRLWQGERVITLEAISLVEEPRGLVMYVRHFDTALVPMEKERAIELLLVERDGEAFHFENVNEGQNPLSSTMTRTDDGFESVSILGGGGEIRVEYERTEG